MRKIFTNLYKLPDIFSCPHSSHQKFGGAVTPHHILNEKKCFPDGCMVFVWKCRLLDKGHSCPKKFKHVGRKCFSCKHYFEEKYVRQPKLKISDEEFRKFKNRLEDLDFWLDEIVGREIELEGTIETIKPNFRPYGNPRRERFAFLNWLAVFRSAHIGYDLFEDVCFARISDKTQSRFVISPGDHILCRATASFDRGRLIFTRLHNIEHTRNGERPQWSKSGAEVAAATAVRLNLQAEKCLQCRYGCLIDRPHYDDRNGSRSLLCLAGQKAPEECAYPLMKYLEKQRA